MPIRRAKEKKERSLGEHLHVKGFRCASPKCALARRPYKPGAHGKSFRRKALSDFGLQMKEKQKVKVSYGISEDNLRHLFEIAAKSAGGTANKLVELLERRLDNVVYQLGFAPSRYAARQLVGHGHITVNGVRTRSCGYIIDVGDTIAVREGSKANTVFKNLKETAADQNPPAWLSADKSALEGKVVALPSAAETPFEVNLLVEAFSK